jgi:large conductance mechanosensitive channel
VISGGSAEIVRSSTGTIGALRYATSIQEKEMLKEFKEFIARGSVVDLAIGVIIGAAFGKIVTSLIEDIVMPPIGLLLGGVDFSNLFIPLKGSPASVAAAKAGGLPTINYGTFINTVLTFLIVAFVVFFLVRAVNHMKRRSAETAPSTKECPYCFSKIAVKATRCANCTSELQAA